MSSLLFLTNDDFYLTNGQKGKILCHDIKGFAFILFYSTQCVYCQNLIPIFKCLPDLVVGCHFGMINVSNNRAVIEKARDSITPITYVPYMILYINGKPFMRYDGPNEENSIRQFIMEVSQKIQDSNNNKFVENQIMSKSEIPEYTIGKPLYGDDERSYLEYNCAYTKN